MVASPAMLALLRRPAVGLALVVALATLVYAGSLRAGLVFDDRHTILGHVGVTGPLSARAIFLRDFWGEPVGSPTSLGSYRPLATLSFWLDHHVGRGAAWPFHLTNLMIFAALLVRVDWFLARWADDALALVARRAAVLVFGVLAVHTEVVANATGRAEMLALFFSISALAVALEEATGRRLLAAGTLLAAAMLSKESAYPMALVVPVVAFGRARLDARRDAGRFAAVSGAVLVAALALRAALFGRFSRGDIQMHLDNPLVHATVGGRLLGACEVVTHYLEHTLTGIDLSPDYSYSALALGSGARVVVGAAFLIGVATVALRARRSAPRVAEAIALFFASYVAVSHLVIPGTALVADRLFFAPSLWLVVVLALVLDALARRRPRWGRSILAVSAAFAVQQALLSLVTVPAWRSARSVAIYGVATTPSVFRLRLARMAVAHHEGDEGEGAWSALAASALLAAWPRPLAPDYLPAEELPLDERFAVLRAQLGPEYDAVVAGAVRIAQTYECPEAAVELARRHGGGASQRRDR